MASSDSPASNQAPAPAGAAPTETPATHAAPDPPPPAWTLAAGGTIAHPRHRSAARPVAGARAGRRLPGAARPQARPRPRGDHESLSAAARATATVASCRLDASRVWCIRRDYGCAVKSKLVRIGNSFGVRLSRLALARAGFAAERPVKIRVARGRITIVADAGELATEARRQSVRVSERVARDAGFWESLADDEGWR